MATKTKAAIITTANRKTSKVPAVQTAAIASKKASPTPTSVATTVATKAQRQTDAAKAAAITAAKAKPAVKATTVKK